MTEKDKLSRRKLNIYFALGVVVLAALAAVGVIHFKNVVTEPSGNDVWGHMYKSEYLYKALKRGQIYPLYDETWYNGIQLYRYWPPLSYYITALLMCFTGGNVINAYYLLFGVYIFFGGLAFLLIGRRIGRPVFGTALAVLWFFMPENARMYIDEGNMPRMVVSFLLPYLIYFIWVYLREEKRWALAGILIFTMLITVTHIMMIAMIGIGTFLFLLFDHHRKMGIRRQVIILLTMICGILIMGVWLVPSLSGGISSMDSEAASDVITMWMSDLSSSLNPLNRINGDIGAFYFGISVVLLSIAGILLADNKKKSGFILALVILVLTTPDVLPILRKMPMSQALWMTRFTVIAYGFFFLSLIEWERLRKPFVIASVIILVVDAIPSFTFERYSVPANDDGVAVAGLLRDNTSQRASLMDLSSLGSYPSYGVCTDGGASYTFGWAWQGAATADNIMLLNQALENEQYDYLFDRSVELGDDTVAIDRKYIGAKGKTLDDVTASAKKSGYTLTYESDKVCLFKLDGPEEFGVVTQYDGIVIGDYADGITLAFPSFKAGMSSNIEDYSTDELKSYHTVILTGFSYDTRQKAEEMVRSLADSGVNVVIDMTHVPADSATRQHVFLGVTDMSVSLKSSYPIFSYDGEQISTTGFPDDMSEWNTGYITGAMNVTGTFAYEMEQLAFAATDENSQNIKYVGLNLLYYYSVTGDSGAEKIVEDILGVSPEDLPERTLIPISSEITDGGMVITVNDAPADIADGAVINTTLAYQDIFVSDSEIMDENNMLCVGTGVTNIKFKYPLFWPGVLVSIVGFCGMSAIWILACKDYGKKKD